jgi:tetratricopeptide (TPR) repeat protein
MPRRSPQTNKKIILKASLLWSIIFVLLTSTNLSAHEGLHEQIIAITKEIKKDPQNPALYLKRGELYRLHREWKNAERDFNQVEKMNPRLAIVDLGRGKLWLDAQRLFRAKQVLERFLAKEPNSFEGVLTVARVLARLKQTQKANGYFIQAIALSPQDSAEIYLERAQMLAAAGKIELALLGLDEGIEKLGGLVTLQSAAIDLEIKRKNYDAALARIEKLSAAMPRKESFLLRRGEILRFAGRKCEARKSLIESQKGFESLSSFRKNVRAVKEQMIRAKKLLAQIPAKNCE